MKHNRLVWSRRFNGSHTQLTIIRSVSSITTVGRVTRSLERTTYNGGSIETRALWKRVDGNEEKQGGEHTLPTQCFFHVFFSSLCFQANQSNRLEKNIRADRPSACGCTEISGTRAKSCEHNRHGRTERDSRIIKKKKKLGFFSS